MVEQTSAICMASSRVGVMTSIEGDFGLFAFSSISSAGSENAAVFPVPVLAAAMTSRRSRTRGIACA